MFVKVFGTCTTFDSYCELIFFIVIECRKAFKQIDINKDNRLSWTELRHASDLLGMTLNEKQAKKMIREVDRNGKNFTIT